MGDENYNINKINKKKTLEKKSMKRINQEKFKLKNCFLTFNNRIILIFPD